ncbi:immunoglobulin-like domain-containing protein [Paraferrimonas sp. SM1919]|uniref:polysaccharide lyase family 8 super-sandwich domain-containing protein n=1 Tax=Paraferrimonas sp. SM1919 TaxID=2662263 RepID=UPI0013D56F2D|nr:immunoglobulin-like domain-containing protein [Paraferrimonas sp. SM1919]
MKHCVYVLFSLLVVACGGSSPITATPPPNNNAPKIMGITNINVIQGQNIDLFKGITAQDNEDGDLTLSIVVLEQFDNTSLGQQSLTYQVSDSGGIMVEAQRVITVLANLAPVLTLNGSESISLDFKQSYQELGATAEDDLDGDVTSSINISGQVDSLTPGQYLMRYSVTDSFGNTSELTRSVNVNHNQPPQFDVIGEQQIEVIINQDYVEPGITASDVEDGDLTSQIISSSDLDVKTLGSYQISYQVTDLDGLSVKYIRTIKVVPEPSPSELNPHLLTTQYFDIAIDSQQGDEVVGRINYANNYQLSVSSQMQGYRFELYPSSPLDPFMVMTEVDSSGKLFGRISLENPNELALGSVQYWARLKDAAGEMVASKLINIEVTTTTQWQAFYQQAKDFIATESRLYGRTNLTSSEVSAYVDMLNNNQGQFTDLSLYSGSSLSTSSRNDQLIKAAKRIGGLGWALKNYSGNERTDLVNAIYLAISAYVDIFPLTNFANDTTKLSFNARTHQWEYTDPISGAAVLAFVDMQADIKAGNATAIKAYEDLHKLLVIGFDLPEAWRQPDHLRYYLEEQLPQSTGAWADANRHHRMRTWVMQVALIKDYNQPMTYLPWWYSDYEPFASLGMTILPEWQPSGSFADLNTWLETNTQYIHKWGQSGIMPDGTISHHMDYRQDMAFWAYGLEWMSKTNFHAAAMFNNSPWQLSNKPLNESAEFLVFNYPKLIYNDVLDFQVAGRSHASSDMDIFGSKHMIRAINAIDDAKSTDSVIAKQQQLDTLRSQMNAKTHDYAGNYAYWLSDFMLHRRDSSTQPFYMSVKMNSGRTMGAENFEAETGFHNGAGVFQIKVDGDEYTNIINRWDWHALPGTTEELRVDQTPQKNDQRKFNPNYFAGTVSDGTNGAAAFSYQSSNTYTSAKADKAYFFVDNLGIAVGNSIARLRNASIDTGGNILTTIDQTNWKGTLSYQINGSGLETIANSQSPNLSFDISAPSWLHQNKVGYLIIPTTNTKLLIKGGSSVTDSTPSSSSSAKVVHIALDHGHSPTNADYHYVAVANVTASEMPSVLQSYLDTYTVTNSSHSYSLSYLKDGLKQAQVAVKGAVNDFELAFNDGQSLTLSTDKGAMLMLSESTNDWQVTVQDPYHNLDSSLSKPENKYLTLVEKQGPSSINLTLDTLLQSGDYFYPRLGIHAEQVNAEIEQIQKAVVVNSAGSSSITVDFADRDDMLIYDYRQALYSGMPARLSIPKQ